jgi:hypothetical protein
VFLQYLLFLRHTWLSGIESNLEAGYPGSLVPETFLLLGTRSVGLLYPSEEFGDQEFGSQRNRNLNSSLLC